MKNICPTSAFLLATFISGAAYSQELTAEDYPTRPAAAEELLEHCDLNQLIQTPVLLNTDFNTNKPFQLLSCFGKRVGGYDCTTLGRLIEFEYDIKEAMRLSGNPIEEGTLSDDMASSFTPLIVIYDDYCQMGLS